jgi:putative transposase
VKIHKGFRYRIYPTPEQEARLVSWESALRSLWNLALEQRRMGLARPKDERIYPTAFDPTNELTDLRAELPWLADVPRNVCAQVIVELDKAWQRCFKRLARAPRFKKKGRDTLGLSEPHPKVWRLDGSSLRFPKIGSIRTVVHRPLEGKAKSCTIRRDSDEWYASIMCEVEIADPVPRTQPIVAIDRGVVNIVADSDGLLVENPRFYKNAMKRLARAQRSVSRKKKGSKNHAKAKVRVANIHRKVRRQRDHFVHNLSAYYAKNHGTVILERLKIKNMTRSASGTVEDPGTNVRQKSGLNRGILDSGWGKLHWQLDYKLTWTGGRTLEEDPPYGSQTCSVVECGHVDQASRISQSVFCCTKCGHREHADTNAAKVYKTRALNRSGLLGEATGLPVRRTKKQLRVVRRSTEKPLPSGRG